MSDVEVPYSYGGMEIDYSLFYFLKIILFYFLIFFFDSGSHNVALAVLELYRPGWPGTHKEPNDSGSEGRN